MQEFFIAIEQNNNKMQPKFSKILLVTCFIVLKKCEYQSKFGTMYAKYENNNKFSFYVIKIDDVGLLLCNRM